MNKKSGFTLAEVLITLMIIGVIAAMTIPSLIQSTESKEYAVAFKKAMATLNQVVSLHYALDNERVTSSNFGSVINTRLNVVDASDGYTTADGINYKISGSNITIDVNGKKGPNQGSTAQSKEDVKAGKLTDVFTATIGENGTRILPANTYATFVLYQM